MTATTFMLLAALMPAGAGLDHGPTKPVVSPDTVTITFPKDGLAIESMLHKWTELTGRRFNFRESDLRGRGNVMVTADVTVKKENVDSFFQSLLIMQGFALIPLGPPEAELYSIEPVDSSRILKQTAKFVPREKLGSMTGNRGEVIMTSIQLKHVDVNATRGAVQQLLSNRQAEFAQEVLSNNSLIVVGFAPTVAALEQLLTVLDVPAPDTLPTPKPPRRGK